MGRREGQHLCAPTLQVSHRLPRICFGPEPSPTQSKLLDVYRGVVARGGGYQPATLCADSIDLIDILLTLAIALGLGIALCLGLRFQQAWIQSGRSDDLPAARSQGLHVRSLCVPTPQSHPLLQLLPQPWRL